MKKIIILNHSTEEVLITNYDPNIWESPEDMVDEFGVALINSNCSYMVVDELILKIN